MSRSEVIRFLILRSLGNFLILLALYGVIVTFGPAVAYEFQYQVIKLRHLHFTINDTKSIVIGQKSSSLVKIKTGHQPGFADILTGNQEQVLTPIDPLFSILILKLGIDEKVFPNIDPNDQNTYLPVLQRGIAHAKGSVFPGDRGIIYLFAHSADNWWDIEHYNAVFYTLNNLSDGDEIVIFYQNQRYNYTVSQKLISDPQDVSLLTAKHEGPQQLVLQTCWPPGTTWKRLYIIAVPKSAQNVPKK